MKLSLARALALGVVVSFGTAAYAEPPGDPKAVKSEDGKYLDAQGDPTYNVKPTARSIGTPSPAIVAITRNAMSATARTAPARPMLPL